MGRGICFSDFFTMYPETDLGVTLTEAVKGDLFMKKIFWFIILLIFAFCMVLLIFSGNSEKNDSKSNSNVSDENSIAQKEEPIYKQLLEFGFNEEEAKTIEKHFNTVGITSINNVKIMAGTDINNLCAFQCKIFDYDSLTLNFTIENRQLCYAEIAGLPSTNVDYFYVNIFGNVKAKTQNGITSVTLYDVWDSNGEIIPGAVGYKAVFDYNNKEIKPYSK